MISRNILFKNKLNSVKIKIPKKYKKTFSELREEYLNNKIPLLQSFEKNYKINFNKKNIKKIKKESSFNIIGMGGSTLGSKAIYSFLSNKIKKKFYFFDSLEEKKISFLKKKKQNNIIISKSGNTLETIVNFNLILKNCRSNSNIFITESKSSTLRELAKKFRDEIIEHKNFIGGRYSVMSEVGMLPAYLMGLKIEKFKKLNNLILNKNFINCLISNVFSIHKLMIKKKNNCVILNFDPDMHDFCLWYQQLIAESLGKKGKGFLPIISSVPKDHHSLLQYYLDGPKNYFYTFFSTKHFKNFTLKDKSLLGTFDYLEKKSLEKIINTQKEANENIFLKKKNSF